MKNKVIGIVLGVLFVAFCFVGCAQTAETSDTATASTVPSSSLSDSDTDISWSDSDTKITLNGSSIDVTGSGVTVSGNVATITTEGTYVVSGTLDDGQIAIAATNTEKVHLVLNGAKITNKSGAAIYASQCDKLIVTLEEGTTNTLTDGGTNYQYADTTNEEPNAALFSKDDLTINGTGTLTVDAGFNNGIGTKDDLLIVNGNITVNAANHGLRGNDSVTVIDGSLNITASNDGVQTNNTEDPTLGWILIENGILNITAGHDGIQADTSLAISGGTFNISTATTSIASSDSTSDSYKGIKTTGDMIITGGTFNIKTTDDSVHANGNITIDDGDFTIASGDDGIHSDGDLVVSGGNIKVTEAYEGLEAVNITITDGIIDVTTSDDGINAAGGADQSGDGGGVGGPPSSAGGNYSIKISGGTITVKAGGDGLDSNGTVDISGGTIISIINSTPDNGAIDTDGTVTFTGGTIIYGGTGLESQPGSDSSQSYVYTGTGITAGSEITVKKDGQTLITYTATETIQYLALSSPDIKSGESYEIYSGSNLIDTVTAGTGGENNMGGAPGGGGMGPGGR